VHEARHGENSLRLCASVVKKSCVYARPGPSIWRRSVGAINRAYYAMSDAPNSGSFAGRGRYDTVILQNPQRVDRELRITSRPNGTACRRIWALAESRARASTHSGLFGRTRAAGHDTARKRALRRRENARSRPHSVPVRHQSHSPRRTPNPALSEVGRFVPCSRYYPEIPSRRAAVPPRMAMRSSSVSPGVFSTRSTSVLVHGNG
jgi:hypothetical protein